MTHFQIGTKALEIDMSKLGDDPIAYSFGFMQGFSGVRREKPQDRHGLAPAYVEGHAHGVLVKSGTEPLPAWARLSGG